MKVYDKKVAIEDEFRAWVAKDEARIEKYGEALDLIESAYKTNQKIALNRTYLNEAIFMGSEIMYWSFKMNRSIASLPKEGKERNVAIRAIKKRGKRIL
jgi:ABC-type taurine transport system ATPase subunit